ncbi:polymerase [Pediococcus acidilactici]|uniref:polymerase n=1 Tax=Pediococcus acidilactici TaxID=1254 RepID=UPI001FB82B7F|nr:polymerase [Pediococcus acidilactici]
MDIVRKENSLVFQFFDYLIILFIILGTQSVLNATTDNDLHIPIVLSALLAIRILTLLTPKTNIGPLLLFIVCWVTYICVYAVFTHGNFMKLIQIFIIAFLLLTSYFYLYIQQHPIQQLLTIYSNIIFFIACLSLFFWLFGTMLNVVKPSGVLNINWGADIVASNYYYLYYQWQHDAAVFGHSIFRNIGIFCEAPMFSLNLSTAFMLDYLITDRRTFKRFFVYLLTFLTTVSVTGIMLFLIVIVLDKFFEYVRDSFIKKRFRVGIVLFPLMAIIAFFIAYHLLVNKLSSASGSSRMQDYITGFKAWQLHPFLGNGFNDISARISFSSFWRLARSQTGYTNSIMTVLSEGGIYLFIAYLTTFLYVFKLAIKKRNYKLIIFVMMWIYLFLTTTFAHTMLMISFLAVVFSLIISKNQVKDHPFNYK